MKKLVQKVNFDNLMLADFLANNKISYIKNTLFYYRKKNRKETAVIRKQKGVYQFQTLSIYLFLIFVNNNSIHLFYVSYNQDLL